MPIVPVRQRDRARPALPHQPDDVGNLRVGADDAAVGPAQVDAPGGAEHLAGIFSFALALVGRAVRAQLAACQVAEPDAIAARRMDGHGSGQADLDVVGMRAEGEEVDWVWSVVNSQPPSSQIPRHSQLPNPTNSQITTSKSTPNWPLGVGSWHVGRLPASGRAAMAQIRQTSRTTETLNMAMRTSRRRTPHGCRRARYIPRTIV